MFAKQLLHLHRSTPCALRSLTSTVPRPNLTVNVILQACWMWRVWTRHCLRSCAASCWGSFEGSSEGVQVVKDRQVVGRMG